MDVIQAEPRITLLTEQRIIEAAASGSKITAVISQSTRSACRFRIDAKYFSDCTGDTSVGYHAGTDYEVATHGQMGVSHLWSALDAGDKQMIMKCECKDKSALTICQ